MLDRWTVSHAAAARKNNRVAPGWRRPCLLPDQIRNRDGNAGRIRRASQAGRRRARDAGVRHEPDRRRALANALRAAGGAKLDGPILLTRETAITANP